MMRTLLLGLWLGMASISACVPPSALGAATDFAPEELRAFSRSTLVIEHGKQRHKLQIWLARSEAEHQQGLMYIRRLPADYGMLFLLGEPRPMSMWMKNTYVSLDMLFLDAQGRILQIAPRTTPLSENIIYSSTVVAAVLEVAGGECARRGIEVGDRVVHPELAPRN